MSTVREKINPVSYEVELVRDGEKVVEVIVRALPGTELAAMHVRNALQAVLPHLPRGGNELGVRRTAMDANRIAEYAAKVEELELPAFEMAQVIAAYEGADGRVTDLYLARLAYAYEKAAEDHRDVSMRMATALNRPVQTVKGHLMRARKEGFLTPAIEGREGGGTTAKAKDLIVAGPRLPELYRPITERRRETTIRS